MTCYKCGTEEGLSIKARHRDGRVRIMICKTCRNQKYHEQPRYEKIDHIAMDKWLAQAELSYLRVFRVRKPPSFRTPVWACQMEEDEIRIEYAR